MKTEVKKLDPTKREINVAVEGDVVKNKFEEVFKKIAKEAKVPGFRPGNAPRDILEKHYGSYAHQEVMKELVPEVYHQAIDKEGLEVVELPSISDVKLEANTLTFKAQVEVAPEIQLKNYKAIKLDYKKIEVTEEEVKRNLDALKESRKIASLDDNFARSCGYPDLDALTQALTKQIYLQKDNQQRQNIENQIIAYLTKDTDFKIPQALIKRQLEDLLRQAKLDLALKGMPREDIESREKELAKELEPQATRQVEIYLILSAIAKKENIATDEHMARKVMEFLLRQAQWSSE
jgi:FKBP-type peptidyl-prolyl cis-trans isomerase (trigger factor)